MKGLRRAALGLAVVVCLLTAAPAAWAGGMDTPRAMAGGSQWIGEWMERIAGWFRWSGPRPADDQKDVRPVFEHNGCGLDPWGVPKPCPPGMSPVPPEGPGGPLGG